MSSDVAGWFDLFMAFGRAPSPDSYAAVFHSDGELADAGAAPVPASQVHAAPRLSSMRPTAASRCALRSRGRGRRRHTRLGRMAVRRRAGRICSNWKDGAIVSLRRNFDTLGLLAAHDHSVTALRAALLSNARRW